MTPVLAEFIGTAVMLLLGTGVCANVSLARTKGNGAGWIVVIVTWAMAVFTGVVIAGPYSGAHLNPSVTLAFAATGQFPWSDVPGYVLAQMRRARWPHGSSTVPISIWKRTPTPFAAFSAPPPPSATRHRIY
mgnify:CR=1 FL=1